MPPFYGNPQNAPPGVTPTGVPETGTFIPGRERFPNPMWQQQQGGAETGPGWGSPHFQPPSNQIQPHMEFHQQQAMYQGYQPTAYAPPFDYPQEQRAGYGVQQFASTRTPSSPARFPQQTHTPQPSPNNPTVNGINGRGPMNNGQYVDSSPSSASSGQYVNGAYSQQSQQDNSMTHPPSASPAPPGRNSSAGSVYDSTDTSSQGKPNGPQAGNNNNFSSNQSSNPSSNSTGHPNGHPGYPLPRPQLSSLNSSGYSGNVSVVGDQQPPSNSPCWGPGNAVVEQQGWGEQSQQQQQQQQQSPPPGGGMANGGMFSGQHREHLNTRLKSMILNKQQHQYQQYPQYNQYSMHNPGGGNDMINPPPNNASYNNRNNIRENGNENGQTQQPPESAPDFLVQGPPQTSVSEGGLCWDWVEGTSSNNSASRIVNNGLERGRTNTGGPSHFVAPELPRDVKDFLSGNRTQPAAVTIPPVTTKSNWHSPVTDRATTANVAVEAAEIFSSPVSKPKLTPEQTQQQNLLTDDKTEFHKQIGLNTQQQASFPEMDLGAGTSYSPYPTKEEIPKVTVKQESLFPYEMSAPCTPDTKPNVAAPEMKKERIDVASYLDQQKAAERNKCWSPTPPPAPPPPPQANDFNKGLGNLSSKEYQDHMERLKNNVRAEVPDCNCFPAEKCKLKINVILIYFV
jgi:hypothetical protein